MEWTAIVLEKAPSGPRNPVKREPQTHRGRTAAVRQGSQALKKSLRIAYGPSSRPRTWPRKFSRRCTCRRTFLSYAPHAHRARPQATPAAAMTGSADQSGPGGNAMG